MHKRLLGLALLLMLAACSDPKPPIGKWEGGYDRGGTLVAARVEILANGRVLVSAPDYTNAIGKADRLALLRARLASELANNWGSVEPRSFDFDGKTFRKPGGVAPQMVWDKDSNQMTLQLYLGANPALPIPLRPVAGFHDNPFGSS